MNKILLILTALLLSGCYDIEGYKIKKMQEACANRGGLDRVETLMWVSVYCEDGTYISRPLGK